MKNIIGENQVATTSKNWLTKNIKGKPDEVMHHWQQSYPLRLNCENTKTSTFSNFTESWPIVKEKCRLVLVSIFTYINK